MNSSKVGENDIKGYSDIDSSFIDKKGWCTNM